MVSQINKEVFLNEFLDGAISDYLYFRENGDEYDEEYKYDILEKMNQKLQKSKINSENVIEIIKYYQKFNPSAGTFVYWSNLDNLLKYAEVKPAEVSELLLNLFDSNIDTSERIKIFYDKAKGFKSDINLGTSLFAYLLAGYDYLTYPIYKDNIFADFIKLFNIKVNINTMKIYDKYGLYYDICHILLKYFKEKKFWKIP